MIHGLDEVDRAEADRERDEREPATTRERAGRPGALGRTGEAHLTPAGPQEGEVPPATSRRGLPSPAQPLAMLADVDGVDAAAGLVGERLAVGRPGDRLVAGARRVREPAAVDRRVVLVRRAGRDRVEADRARRGEAVLADGELVALARDVAEDHVRRARVVEPGVGVVHVVGGVRVRVAELVVGDVHAAGERVGAGVERRSCGRLSIQAGLSQPLTRPSTPGGVYRSTYE